MKIHVHFPFLAASFLALSSLVACGSEEKSDEKMDAGTEQLDGSISGDEDSGVVQDSDAGTDPEEDAGDEEDDVFLPKPVPAGDEDQLAACFVPSEWPEKSFDKFAKYVVENDPSYEFTAYDEYADGSAQALWVELYPANPERALTGTFDLSNEPLDYGTCERCVVIQGAPNEETMGKHYMPASGTLTLSKVTSSSFQGTLENVELVEVVLTESQNGTIHTEHIKDGCTTRIERLEFGYEPPQLPEHVAQCFVPEPLDAKALSDYVLPYSYDKAEDNYFYRSMTLPAPGSGMPSIQFFVEVYEPGTGTFTFDGKDCENNGPECMHMVIVDSVMPNNSTKSYIATSGSLTLTTLTSKKMEGVLENLRFQEIEYLDDGEWMPVKNGCDTTLKLLAFSSDDETILED